VTSLTRTGGRLVDGRFAADGRWTCNINLY